ncbi:uncharacterized protein LOC122638619 [Telopea speciosissima]|uniref:uncharacterized protein LOC122638619 n=1 Tax=Telopea speciosissima TaxID=54955 RepID=UPI001CC431A3|nr:uncharacterized protein LOC122638619 [Telopea speciosissima]
MTSHHPAELDSGAADSVTSSPRSDHELHPHVRFMCSFGGRILPRPHDNQLRYVGGDTRIVAVHRTTRSSALLSKLSKLSGSNEITIKYQLPNEELDALITVSTDDDVENMMEEYDRLTQGSNSKTARLRLFLFPVNGSVSSASSISSIIDGQSKRVREHWFFDALNGGGGVSATPSLERGRSEVSSVVSEVPDYLFGFDNSDEPKPKTRPTLTENVSFSDPGSPAYGSTSSQPCVPSISDLPPVKTKLEDPNHVSDSKESQIDGFRETGDQPVSRQTGYMDNTTWQYFPASHFPGPAVQPMQVYYMPGPVPPCKVPSAAVPVPANYVQRFPMGFAHPVHGVGQVYAGGVKAVTAMEPYDQYPPGGVVPEPQAYYAARNPGMIPSYPAAGAELQGSGTETIIGRVSQPQ